MNVAIGGISLTGTGADMPKTQSTLRYLMGASTACQAMENSLSTNALTRWQMASTVYHQERAGGCVTTGPFEDYVVNLGPYSPSLRLTGDNTTLAVTTGFEHNSRCLRRDISPFVSSQWSTDAQSYDLIKSYKDIASFQDRMQGDFPNGFFGVHTAGHFTIGGDPSGDFSASPGEPAFYLHHAQIDRTWWIWQNLDAANRLDAYEGPTFVFDASSPPGQLTDELNIGNLGSSVQVQEVVDTTSGLFAISMYSHLSRQNDFKHTTFSKHVNIEDKI